MNKFYLYVGLLFCLIALGTRLFGSKDGFLVILGMTVGFVALYIFELKNAPPQRSAFLFSAFSILLTTYIVGLNHGRRDIGDPATTGIFAQERLYVLSFKTTKEDKKITEDKKVYLLRNFERGVLVRDVGPSVVSFYPWAELQSIRDAEVRPPSKSIVCAVLRAGPGNLHRTISGVSA